MTIDFEIRYDMGAALIVAISHDAKTWVLENFGKMADPLLTDIGADLAKISWAKSGLTVEDLRDV